MLEILIGILIIVSTTWIVRYNFGSKRNATRYTTEAEHQSKLDVVLNSLNSRKRGHKISLHHRVLQSNTIRNASHKSGESAGYHPVDLSSFDRIIAIEIYPGSGNDCESAIKITPSEKTKTQHLDDDESISDRDEKDLHIESKLDIETCGYVICEPGVTFGNLLTELLKHGLSPLIVIEFPEITVGGAISGGGLESSSHRYGQFMDTILEIECIVPQIQSDHLSKIVHCSPRGNQDLFYSLSASYNTVAIIASVKIRVKRAERYVRLELSRFGNIEAAIDALSPQRRKAESKIGRPDGDTLCNSKHGSLDTLEGIAFAPDDIVVIQGQYTNESHGEKVCRFSRHWDQWYYKVIRDLSLDLTTRTSGEIDHSFSGSSLTHANSSQSILVPYKDYCFRYNYGAFWMASFIPELLPFNLGYTLITRYLIGWLLDTKHLFAVLHSSKLTDLGRMRIIQDCYVPLENIVRFLNWEMREIGVWPIWLCPVKGVRNGQYLACNYVGDHNLSTNDPGRENFSQNTTGSIAPDDIFVNVGIYGRPREFPFDAPRLNNSLVEALIKHNARSMLYAQIWHSLFQFKTIYGRGIDRIDRVKRKYGSLGTVSESTERDECKEVKREEEIAEEDCFFDLYEKVALKESEKVEMGIPVINHKAIATRGTEELEKEAHWKIFKDVLWSKMRRLTQM